MRAFVRVRGSVRKEFFEMVRQPQLLLVMVLGPFIVLALFGAGFDQQQTVLRTLFVGPAEGPYEESLDEFAGELQRYVDNAGYSTDLVAASALLEAGDIDLVVVFPGDPIDDVLSGEQATIRILHDKIDPIAQTTVEVSAQVAVQELNATIIERVVGGAQTSLVPLADGISDARSLLDIVADNVEGGDESTVATALDALESSARAITAVSEVSLEVADRLGADEERLAPFIEVTTAADGFESTVRRLVDGAARVDAADVAELQLLLDIVSVNSDLVTTLDPTVIVRPFQADTANLQRESVTLEAFFAPASIALLLQHMVLTFAALSMVSDRALGLFELFKVGSSSAGRIVAGKFVSFLLAGIATAIPLFVAARYGLGVPMRGSVVWLAIGIVGVLVASIGLGTTISLIARTDTQTVQYALLALLAGLFFSGFFLDLSTFRYPFKFVSFLLPVTYGNSIFRDVLLRGNAPAVPDLLGLVSIAVAYALLSWGLLKLRLRVR